MNLAIAQDPFLLEVRAVIGRDIIRGAFCQVMSATPGQAIRTTCTSEQVELRTVFGGGAIYTLGSITGAERCSRREPCIVDFRVLCAWQGLANAQACDDYGVNGLLGKALITFSEGRPLSAAISRNR